MSDASKSGSATPASAAGASPATAKAERPDVVPYSRLFLFATPADKAMLAVGVIAGLGAQGYELALEAALTRLRAR